MGWRLRSGVRVNSVISRPGGRESVRKLVLESVTELLDNSGDFWWATLRMVDSWRLRLCPFRVFAASSGGVPNLLVPKNLGALFRRELDFLEGGDSAPAKNGADTGSEVGYSVPCFRGVDDAVG